MTLPEKTALALYVLLDRDPSDFADELRNEKDETLDLLQKLLTKPNPKHTEKTIETNKLGASILATERRRRKNKVLTKA